MSLHKGQVLVLSISSLYIGINVNERNMQMAQGLTNPAHLNFHQEDGYIFTAACHWVHSSSLVVFERGMFPGISFKSLIIWSLG